MTDILTAFWTDVETGVKQLENHETGGAWAALVLSFLLTIWVWFIYGASAGAPLLASFLICAAVLFH